MRKTIWVCASAMLMTVLGLNAQDIRVDLKPEMIHDESDSKQAVTIVNEQRQIIGAPTGAPMNGWKVPGNQKYPFSVTLDLGQEKNLSKLWIFDTFDSGDLVISTGTKGAWKEVTTYNCKRFKTWVPISLDTRTRYIRLTKKSAGANFSEIAVYEYSDAAWAQMLAEKARRAKEEAARQAAIKKAMDEMKKRPLVDLGEPFGKAYLIDEVDCTKTTHEFAQSPANASEIQTILGKRCRVLKKTVGEGAYFTYRVGKMKLLQPGASYILVVDYPEDKPRTVIVSNTGNETIRGFHTGTTNGDAFHPKYVNNLNESINVPLSGQWESWTHLFRLHDRFTTYNKLPRGVKPRPFTPEDGFYVSVMQLSARNIPMSHGAAVSRIRLFAVPDKTKLVQSVHYPPENLPKRRLFWREEMADGVIAKPRKGKVGQPGVTDHLNWYTYKAERMQFLGMNTFAKDLLEFGANQGWDPTRYGGNKWVYFNPQVKDLWMNIVTLMGEYNFAVFPYYEYAGSKGQKGLGFEKRPKPLARKDGNFMHIKWIETAKADITDPDTYEDFKKMLDLTVIAHQEKAEFIGAWVRPRSQLPVSFADATLKRFNTERGKKATRDILIKDQALYATYIDWFGEKRRDFLKAMRDHLRQNGVKNAKVMYTGCPSEPGVKFPTWDPIMVTDNPAGWADVLKGDLHRAKSGDIRARLTVNEVVAKDLYLTALQSPGLDWGGWEVRHARPADDPHHYQKEEGLMLTHAFNRLYTVSSPKTFDAYRTVSDLVMLRHYSLNENMMYDKKDKAKAGYFIADMERAGPYCMMGEALGVANGDPTMIGYLSGGNFGRGFPKYARDFNAAFLSLPALPSKRLKSSNNDIVIREIRTPANGTYYAVVNTSMKSVNGVSVVFPQKGKLTDAAAGKTLSASANSVKLDLYPYELRTFHIQ